MHYCVQKSSAIRTPSVNILEKHWSIELNMLFLNILGVDVLGDRKRRRASWDMGFKGDYMDFQNNKPLQNVIRKAYVYVIKTIHEIIKLRTTKLQFFHYRFNESGGEQWNFWEGEISSFERRGPKNKNELRGELSEVSPSREEWIESNRYRDNVHLLITFIRVSRIIPTTNIIGDASLIISS